MAAVLTELLLLFATAAFVGLGHLWAAVPMFFVLLWRGYRTIARDATDMGWEESLLSYLVPASAVICYRAISSGHWF